MNHLDIKKKRKELKLTQEELAEKVGVTRRTIVSYEKGALIPESTAKLLESLLFKARTLDTVAEPTVEYGKNASAQDKLIASQEETIATLREEVQYYRKELSQANQTIRELTTNGISTSQSKAS